MKQWVVAGICAAALAVGAYLAYQWRGRVAPAQLTTSARYAPVESCQGCHPAIWKTYRQTGMGRAFSAFAFDRTPADFGRRNKFYHKPSDSHFTMLRRGGEAFMRRHQIGPAGEEINVVEKRIDYIMGSGHTGQTLIHRNPRNELIELPVAWYIAKGGYWAMNPNYDQPNHEGFRRRIRYDCFFCHNGYPDMQGRPDDFLADPIYPAKLP